ncbi:MAG: hypothetical protein ACM35G_13865, partial [Planctomycetaceae bacterium]
MRISAKLGKHLGIGAAVAIVALIIVRAWAVPALIRSQLQAQFEGKVDFRDWWLNGRSSGVVGLALHEGPGTDSPVFASAERVATDLSLPGLLRGRLSPRRITLDSPKVTFRLDRDGRFANLPALRGGGGRSASLPSLAANGAEVTFRPEGRPEMVVRGIDARLDAGPRASALSARTDGPYWGHWEASGTIDPSFRAGSVGLVGERFAADPEKLARVPFVPSVAWSHVVPRGPVGVQVAMRWGAGGSSPVETRAEVTFLDTQASFPSLSLDATGTTGRLVIADGV